MPRRPAVPDARPPREVAGGGPREVAGGGPRPWLVGLVAALGALAVIAVLVAAAGTGVSGLVHAAPPWTLPGRAPSSLHVLSRGEGFDGQFYYRIAISPLSDAWRVAGVRFDIPTLRHYRWGYGALGWLVSFGRPALVPWALPAINVVAIGAIAAVGARLARDGGLSAWWGLAFVAFPGFVFTLGFDLAEALATALTLGAVLAIRRDRLVVAAALMCAAAVTRETALLLPFALLLALALPEGRAEAPDWRRRLVVSAAPVAVAIVWQLWLRAAWGSLPANDAQGVNLRLPFQGLWDQRHQFLALDGEAAFRVLLLALLVLVAGVALASWRRSTARAHEKVMVALGVLLMLMLSEGPWAGATSFMRGATELYVFSVVVLLAAPRRLWALAPGPMLFVVTLGVEIAKRR